MSTPEIEQNEPIRLGWAQELAASWSILWPSWLVSFLFLGLLLTGGLDYLLQHPTVVFAIGNFILLFAQAVLTFRLVRKNYRSFWIGILHDSEPLKRRFLLSEQARVALQISWPHVAVLLLVVSFLFFWKPMSAEMAQRVNSFGLLFRVLVVGPAAIRWAMYVNYHGFRLQAYRRKRSIDGWSSLRHLEAENDSVE